MKVDLSRYDQQNTAYRKSIGASSIKQVLWFFCSVLLIRNPLVPSSSLRKRILVLFGAHIGIGSRIRPGVIIKFPWKLRMGDHVWLGENCWIDNMVDVEIGSHCCISQGAMICTGNHDYRSPLFSLTAKPVVLGDGVWIGAGAIVCPGVIAGEQAVLTAGSVVVGQMEANGIYQGNPALFKRRRV